MLKRMRWWNVILMALAATVALPVISANARPELVFDVKSGEILFQKDAALPWYPASLSKLMTVYVALKLVQTDKFSFDSPFIVTRRAAVMPAAKMGFEPGTIITLGNALQILMVKSANDVAVTVAEGLGGSVEGFSTLMNQYAAKIGMRESHFVSPNGLPDPRQISSARDMALLASAIYHEFPEEAAIFSIGELQFGGRMIHTYNGLLGRYPGADGMKTGFTCAAGFNIVAGATRQGRHLIAVVMGKDSVKARNATAADLLEDAFNGKDKPSGQIGALPVLNEIPPDMHDHACGPHRHSSEAGDESEPEGSAPAPIGEDVASGRALPISVQTPTSAGASDESVGMALARLPKPQFTPVPVYIGQAPGKNLAVTPVVTDPSEITPFPPRHHRKIARRDRRRVTRHVVARQTKPVVAHKHTAAAAKPKKAQLIKAQPIKAKPKKTKSKS